MRRFELGLAMITPGALELLGSLEVSPTELLERHASGDWGEIPSEDARENELALERGFRVMSSYPLSGGVRVWVITERDRSLTTILLPAEY
jgi:hypothetical protein